MSLLSAYLSTFGGFGSMPHPPPSPSGGTHCCLFPPKPVRSMYTLKRCCGGQQGLVWETHGLWLIS